MNMARYEQETIISFNEEEKTAGIYTHNKMLRQKLAALARDRPEDCRLDTVVQTGGICEDGRLTVYLSEGDFARSDGDAILSVGEAEYAAASDAAGTPILLDESTDPYLLHLIGLSAGDWVHALSAEAPDLKDGVYTVSVIIERVRPLDFVLN